MGRVSIFIVMMLILVKWGLADDRLASAARLGDLKTFDALVSAGTVLKGSEYLKSNLLHDAVISGRVEMVLRVLELGVAVDEKDDLGWTPLMLACANNQVSIVDALRQHGADLQFVDVYGRSLLCHAASRKHEEMIAFLLQQGLKTTRDGHGLAARDFLPLDASAQLYELLSPGLTESVQGEPFVTVVAAKQDDEILLEPKIEGRAYVSDLLKALWRGDDGGFRNALKRGKDLNSLGPFGETALHLALERDNQAALTELLAAGVKCNQQDRLGWTPLALACYLGQEQAVKHLIAAGADPNLGQEQGMTPLMWAAHKNYEAIAKYLMAHGADRGARDARGRTALDHVNSVRFPAMAKFLVHMGVVYGIRSPVTAEPDPFRTREVEIQKAASKVLAKPRPRGEVFFVDSEAGAAQLADALALIASRDTLKAQASLDSARSMLAADDPALIYVTTLLELQQQHSQAAEASFQRLRAATPSLRLLGRLSFEMGKHFFSQSLADYKSDRYLTEAWRLLGDAEPLVYLVKLQQSRALSGIGMSTLDHLIAHLGSGDARRSEFERMRTAWAKRVAFESGAPLDDLEVSALADGKPLDLKAFRGKVVLLHFFTTWDQKKTDDLNDPLPALLRYYKWHPKRPYVSLAICGDSDENAVRTFCSEKKIPWPVYLDPGLTQSGLQLGVTHYPTFMILDGEGKVLLRTEGWARNYQANIRKLISEAMAKLD